MTCCPVWNREQHYLRDTAHQERYNPDSDEMLRMKFCSLTFASPIISAGFHVPYKLYSLITGTFAHRGKALADREWTKLQFKKGNDPSKTPPLRIAKHISIELLKDVAKLATYAIAIIAKVFIAFYGLIDPKRARWMMSEVDYFWRVDQTGIEERKLVSSSTCFHLTAPCMLSIEKYKEQNYFRAHDDYSADIDASQKLKLHRLAKTHAYLFQNDLAKEIENPQYPFAPEMLPKLEKEIHERLRFNPNSDFSLNH